MEKMNSKAHTKGVATILLKVKLTIRPNAKDFCNTEKERM
jgi:hypothetical protein